MKKTLAKKKTRFKIRWFLILVICFLFFISISFFLKIANKKGIGSVKGIHSLRGQCGSVINSCNLGNLIDVVDTPTQFRWSCSGVNGGSTVSCFVDTQISSYAAACGKQINDCYSGNFLDVTDTTNQYRWNCRSANKKKTVSCSLYKAKDGVCGKLNSCLSGNYTSLPNSITHYKWKCLGINGGKSAECHTLAPCGLTNDAPVNMCNGGKLVDIPDTNCLSIWRCEKFIDTGWDYVCHKAKVFNGICGVIKNTCTSGIFSDMVDTKNQHRWYCKGCNKSGGTSVTCTLNK